MKNDSANEKENKALNLLFQFGLSKEECALFVFLSRANKEHTNWLKGSDIGSFSKKGRVRTYQILQRLTELGLVKVDFSRPKKYSPVSPQVALRRLLSVQESRLTELSHLEGDAIESLLDLDPIRVESLEKKEESSKVGSVVSLLQGLANIQIALRELMEDSDFLTVASEESLDHILTVASLLANKPRSIRLVVASAKRPSLKGYFYVINDNNITASWFKGDAPTFLVAKDKVIFLYYTTLKKKTKPLSSLLVSPGVSQIAIVNSERYSQQMSGVFDLLWRNSEELARSRRR